MLNPDLIAAMAPLTHGEHALLEAALSEIEEEADPLD